MLLKYYSLPSKYETWVRFFNEKPSNFDYHAYLRQMRDEAKKDSVRILEKKN